jgi:hypothetical protein
LALEVIGAYVRGESFVASQNKIPRHLFRTLVIWRACRPENPVAIGTTQEA